MQSSIISPLSIEIIVWQYRRQQMEWWGPSVVHGDGDIVQKQEVEWCVTDWLMSRKEEEGIHVVLHCDGAMGCKINRCGGCCHRWWLWLCTATARMCSEEGLVDIMVVARKKYITKGNLKDTLKCISKEIDFNLWGKLKKEMKILKSKFPTVSRVVGSIKPSFP